MRELTVVGEEYSVLYCEDCTEEKGIVIHIEMIYGVLDFLTKKSWEVKADIHEQAKDHNVTLINADMIQ